VEAQDGDAVIPASSAVVAPAAISGAAKPRGYMASNGPIKLPPFMLQADTMPKTTATWPEEVYDFGKLPTGSTAVHTFTFRNTGDQALLITMAKASCGCTVPDWTRTPVPPGQEGFVSISFRPGGTGTQTKSVTVIHNGDPIAKVLHFTAEVE